MCQTLKALRQGLRHATADLRSRRLLLEDIDMVRLINDTCKLVRRGALLLHLLGECPGHQECR